MTQPTEADIRAACEEAGVEYVPDWRVWWLGTLQRLVLALARRIEAEGKAVPVLLRYALAKGLTREEMRANIPADLYAQGDCVLIWANEGDLCMMSAALKDTTDVG